MTMPTWDQTMYPALRLLSDGKPHSSRETCEAVEGYFGMSEDEIAETLPSGQRRILNRVGWGLTDMRKAGLVENAGRKGTNRITALGLEYLERYGEGFGYEQLQLIPAFVAWRQEYRGRESRQKADPQVPEPAAETTPEDQIEAAFEQINDALADELIDRVLANDPYFFERLVTRLVIELGYGDLSKGAGKTTKRSGDGGIDGVVRLDRLGLDKVYIQAKRWARDHVVGRPEVQGFVGALMGVGATKGLFITTSSFSDDAQTYATKSMQSSNVSIVLLDGAALARLMIECNVGVSVKATYQIKAVDGDFFETE